MPTDPPPRSRRTRRLSRLLGTTVVVGFAKGMATTIGGAIATALVYWITHH